MTNFGFCLSKSSQIDLDKVNRKCYDEICEREASAKVCMNCGSCTASCTAGAFSGMSLRKVLLGMQRGQDVLGMLSACMLCGKCSMVCPRGINTRRLILTICSNYD